MDKYGKVRQATDDNTAHAFAFSITKATDTFRN
jgi:hypothetical protein